MMRMFSACLALAVFHLEESRAEPYPAAPYSHYSHAGYATLQGGDGTTEYWIFTPDEPRPPVAPVVVFLHGWSGMDPFLYGAWIKHLVQRGNIVIYPRYQTNIKTKFEEMTPGAMHALQVAYRRLQAEGPVRPAPGKLAFVGHSMGGFVATNLAATAASQGLPEPAALMVIEPGDGDGRMRRLGKRLPLVDMSSAPANMAVLLVTGDEDTLVGDRGATIIWKAMAVSPVSHKSYITMESIRVKSGSISADHLSPLATDASFDPEFSINPSGRAEEPRGWFARRKEARHQRLIKRTRNRWADRHEPDAIDFDGYWKLLDEFLDVSFDASGAEPRGTRVSKWFAEIDRPRGSGAPAVRKRVDIMEAAHQE